MNKSRLVVLPLFLLLSACQPSAAQIERAIAETQQAQPTPTPIPSLTPSPTPDLGLF
jgi:hypothetical protein